MKIEGRKAPNIQWDVEIVAGIFLIIFSAINTQSFARNNEASHNHIFLSIDVYFHMITYIDIRICFVLKYLDIKC